MASEISNAPPSVTVSKKKRSSEKFKFASKQARPSEKALAVVPTLPQKQFDYVGSVYEHEDNFADEGARRVDNQKWDEWARDNPKDLVSMEDVAVGKGFRGKIKSKKMEAGGQRSKFYHYVVGYDGTANGKLEEEIFEKPSKSKSRINVGNNRKDFDKIDEDTAVIDADYQNVYKTVPPRDARQLGLAKRNKSSKKLSGGNVTEDFFAFKGEEAPSKFRKAPSKDARYLGLPKRSISKREEPGDMKAISERKRNTISEINDIAKPSTKKKPSLVKSRDLVDEAFDGLVDVGKNVGKIGKTVAKAGVAGIGAGFQAIDKGATAFGNSTIGKNIKAQADADYKHMRSHGFRAAESIKGTGNSQKSGMTAGSLVTQKVYRNVRLNESVTGNTGAEERLEIHGISCRYTKSSHGKVEKHWFYHERQVDFKDVEKVLTAEQIRKLRASADDVFKGHIKIGSFTGSNKGSIPTVGNRGAYGPVNNTKKASASGLVAQKRTRGSHDSDYGNNQAIAGVVTNKTAGGLVANKTNAGGIATMKIHSDVVVGTGKTGSVKTTKTATPEGLFSKKDGGVQAETREASPSKINKRKSGGVKAKTRPATPSKLLGKAGNSEKTVTAGVVRRNGEIGTTKTQHGIVSNPKTMTIGSIVTPKRNAGGTSA